LLFCFVSFAQASSFSIVVLDGISLRISTSSLYYFSCLCKCFQRTLLLCPLFSGTRVQRYYLFSAKQIFLRLFFIFFCSTSRIKLLQAEQEISIQKVIMNETLFDFYQILLSK